MAAHKNRGEGRGMRLAPSQTNIWKVCSFIALGQLEGSDLDRGNLAPFDRHWRKAKQRGV